MSKGSYSKLKEKLNKKEAEYDALMSDFRKYAYGDFQTVTIWNLRFKMERELEESVWGAESAFDNKNENEIK